MDLEAIKLKLAEDDSTATEIILGLASRHEDIADSFNFKSRDANFLTSIAKYAKDRGNLSPAQLQHGRRVVALYLPTYLERGLDKDLPTKSRSRAEKAASSMRKRVEIDPSNDTQMILHFPYSTDLVDKVRSLIGRQASKESGRWIWSAPVRPDNLLRLIEWGFYVPDVLKAKATKEKRKSLDDLPEIGTIPKLKRDLMKFQKQGVAYMEDRKGRVLLADEMGLGKTTEALAWLQLRNDALPALIICPASVKSHWEREAEETGTLKTTILNGKSPDEIDPTADLIIINYDIVGAWVDEIQKRKPRTIVFDEVQKIKNKKTIRYKKSSKIAKKCNFVIGLSGTPIENRPIELHPIIELIDPTLFPDFWTYAKRYGGAVYNGWSWEFKGATNTLELNERLCESIMIRRLKKDVLTELPEKTHTVLPVPIKNRREYAKLENDFLKTLEAIDPEKAARAERAQFLVQMSLLKQAASRGKYDSVLEFVTDMIEAGKKLVVFAEEHTVLDLLQKEFGPELTCRIDGKVSQKKRQAIVDRFNTDLNCMIFLGQTEAAGVGINLQHQCSDVLHVEFGWKPGRIDQASDRVHRKGQKDGVNIWYIVAEGTIEEEIIEMLDTKRRNITAVMDGKDVEEEAVLSVVLKRYKTKTKKEEL